MFEFKEKQKSSQIKTNGRKKRERGGNVTVELSNYRSHTTLTRHKRGKT